MTLLAEKYKDANRRDLPVEFSDTLTFTVKKESMLRGGGGIRTVKFVNGPHFEFKPSGKTLTVTSPPGLPKDSSKAAANSLATAAGSMHTHAHTVTQPMQRQHAHTCTYRDATHATAACIHMHIP